MADPSRDPSSASASVLSTLRRQRATLYPPDPIPLILPGGGISLLAGASGIGKTAFLAWWATRFRDCLPIFQHQPHHIPCQAVLAIDRSWIQSTSKWFELVGYPDIQAYSPLDDPEFKPSWMRNKHRRLVLLTDHMLPRLGTLPPGSLLYIDPIAPFLGGNLLDYDACAVACMEIREIARQKQITVIGTAHTAKLKADKKDRYQRVQDRILGTTALLGYTDTQMYLASPDECESDFYQFFWNPHHAASQTFPLARDSQTGLFLPAEDAPAIALTPVQEAILGLLTLRSTEDEAGTPYRVIQSILEAVAPSSSIHRQLGQLVHRGLVVKLGKGLYKRAVVN